MTRLLASSSSVTQSETGNTGAGNTGHLLSGLIPSAACLQAFPSGTCVLLGMPGSTAISVQVWHRAGAMVQLGEQTSLLSAEGLIFANLVFHPQLGLCADGRQPMLRCRNRLLLSDGTPVLESIEQNHFIALFDLLTTPPATAWFIPVWSHARTAFQS